MQDGAGSTPLFSKLCSPLHVEGARQEHVYASFVGLHRLPPARRGSCACSVYCDSPPAALADVQVWGEGGISFFGVFVPGSLFFSCRLLREIVASTSHVEAESRGETEAD